VPKVGVESASRRFIAVYVQVDRFMAHLSQRVLGKPVADLLRAPLFLADLELDETPNLRIDAPPLPLPGLGVLLGRHETVGP
jgi:hypothetical protein